METGHLTRATIHLDRLSDNMSLLQELAGSRPLWPAIKANAYGHGAEIVVRHLLDLGYDTFCVAHIGEALTLKEAGLSARYLILSASLPAHAEALVAHDFEPAVCTLEMVEALSAKALAAGKQIAIHIMVDTGMGRIGIRPEEVSSFLEHCAALPGLRLRGLMSHFPRADEADKSYSRSQIARFSEVTEVARSYGIEICHMANSAALLDLPDALFDAVRPGIAIYGLRPSWQSENPLVDKLKPVLEWETRITFLKEVPSGAGLSYGHDYHTTKPSLIATVPAGYGDGLSRRLSSGFDILVRGTRCAQVGRITMDQSLVDVTALRDSVALGDRVVLIGKQGSAEVTADELAGKLDTINYEIVTSISSRVSRQTIAGKGPGRS